MNTDWVHMLLTMIIIGIVFWGLSGAAAYRRSSRAGRTGILVVILFPLLQLSYRLWVVVRRGTSPVGRTLLHPEFFSGS